MNKNILRLLGAGSLLALVLILSYSFRSGDPVDDANHPVQVTDANFDEMVSEGVVLVDFWAIWCRPCRMMTPVIDSLAVKMDGRAVIGKLDVDKNRISTTRYGVSSIPTIIIFKDGKAVKRFIGVTSEADLTSALEELLPPPLPVSDRDTLVIAPISEPGRINKELPDPKNPGNAPTGNRSERRSK